MKVTHKGEQPAKVSAEKAVIGNGLMMTGKLMVSIHPAVFVTISVVLKVESLGKICDGFCWVENGEPSPKFHDQFVITPVVGTDTSFKMVGEPKQVGTEVKFATGKVFTKTGIVAKFTQPFEETQIKVTLKVPEVVY